MGDQNPENFQNPPPFAPRIHSMYTQNEYARYQPPLFILPQPPPYKPTSPPQPPLPSFQPPPRYSPPQSYPMQLNPQQFNSQSNIGNPSAVISSTSAPVYNRSPRTIFTWAIVFSCYSIWWCGFIFGIIGYILAMVGQRSTAKVNRKSAKPQLIASYVFSAIGLVTGIGTYIFLIYYYCSYSHTTGQVKPSHKTTNDNWHSYII